MIIVNNSSTMWVWISSAVVALVVFVTVGTNIENAAESKLVLEAAGLD